jgi:hypothetical protein
MLFNISIVNNSQSDPTPPNRIHTVDEMAVDKMSFHEMTVYGMTYGHIL